MRRMAGVVCLLGSVGPAWLAGCAADVGSSLAPESVEVVASAPALARRPVRIGLASDLLNASPVPALVRAVAAQLPRIGLDATVGVVGVEPGPYDAVVAWGATSQSRRVEVAGAWVRFHPALVADPPALRAALAHGLGHALELRHACVLPTDAPDCRYVGDDAAGAVMRPNLEYEGEAGTGLEPPNLAWVYTAADGRARTW